jgi:glucokinase
MSGISGMSEPGETTGASDRGPGPGSAIGLDVGGTKIAGGVVSVDGEVLERMAPLPCPATDEAATITVLRQVITELRARHPDVAAVGIGAAGLVDWPEGRIRWAPNNAYRAVPLRRLLEDATGLPTIVDNDANAAAWAEARRHEESSYLAFLTVGTGVGGGLILDGQLYRGKTGIGAEVGHLIVDPHGGPRCGCGNTGCLEALASGTALGRYGREAAAREPDGVLAELGRERGEVTGEVVFAAARSSDPTALALFERLGHWLGVGIASLVTLFDFDLVVVGGGVAAAADDLLLGTARASFERFVFAREHRQLPAIVPARLGAEAGWIGAGMLALEQHAAGHGARRASSRPSPTGSNSGTRESSAWTMLTTSRSAEEDGSRNVGSATRPPHRALSNAITPPGRSNRTPNSR